MKTATGYAVTAPLSVEASAADVAGKLQSLAARDDGRALCEARVAKGLSQNALAKQARVNHAAVCRLEGVRGVRVLRAGAERIAAALARHANARVTGQVYAGLTESGREKAAAKLIEAGFGS